MPGSFFNCFISAVVGAASAVGTVWYLSDNSETNGLETNSDVISARRLEVDSLVVRDSLLLVDKTSSEPTLELREGSLFAQKGVYAEQIGAFRLLGQKIQTTPDDPLDANSPVFGELATNEDGGAYVALLSPRESHSVTVGFDKNEKGCILSQNNEDMSLVAQAIFLRPDASDASEAPSSSSADSEGTAQSNPSASSATVAQSSEGTIRK